MLILNQFDDDFGDRDDCDDCVDCVDCDDHGAMQLLYGLSLAIGEPLEGVIYHISVAIDHDHNDCAYF